MTTQPVGRHTRRREQTRAKLVVAARTLFARQGVDNTRIRLERLPVLHAAEELEDVPAGPLDPQGPVDAGLAVVDAADEPAPAPGPANAGADRYVDVVLRGLRPALAGARLFGPQAGASSMRSRPARLAA